MDKVLCIDDTPNERIPPETENTLRGRLTDIFHEQYDIIFEENPDQAIAICEKYGDIKLILLDVEFPGPYKQGPEIADILSKVAPSTRIIVLTRIDERGNKIKFGWKRNVVQYIVKKTISKPEMQYRLLNLAKAIIEDYENSNWQIERSGPETMNITRGNESFGFDIPLTLKDAFIECLIYPNRPVTLSDAYNLNKVHNSINDIVREKTDWCTWGILTKEGCAKGQLKLLVGSVVSGEERESDTNKNFLNRKEFDEFKNDVEKKLSNIEDLLNSIIRDNKKRG